MHLKSTSARSLFNNYGHLVLIPTAVVIRFDDSRNEQKISKDHVQTRFNSIMTYSLLNADRQYLIVRNESKASRDRLAGPDKREAGEGPRDKPGTS